MSARPTIIVCERKGAWAAALRRHMPPPARVFETRSIADCRRELAIGRAAVVAVEVGPANLLPALEFVAETIQRYPLVRVVAVGQRGCEPFEWVLREAGAVAFTTSPRAADTIARLALRHAARLPAPCASFASQVWDTLPWAEAATS